LQHVKQAVNKGAEVEIIRYAAYFSALEKSSVLKAFIADAEVAI